jgi:DNA-binding transcriptional MerR regulator
VLYDAAHAFGVQVAGEPVLQHGDLSALSFHATKVFNTFEGGAVACPDAGQARGEARVRLAPEHHRERREEAARAGEGRVVAVVVRDEGTLVGGEAHEVTLTVEPGFKSSAGHALRVADDRRGRPPCRRGALGRAVLRAQRPAAGDARQSGQRRFQLDTLRRLVFIRMLQDAGLSLDDIRGVLDASTVAEWKAIGAARLTALEAEIERLERARSYLQAALLCRFDHPATECKVMGAEIDRRLAASGAPPRPPSGTGGPDRRPDPLRRGRDR